MFSRTILTLPVVAIALVASLLFVPTLKELGTYDLSGTYRFRRSLGQSFTASGYLDLDWLGDISGEAIGSGMSGQNTSAAT
jgi:hypothetical protein